MASLNTFAYHEIYLFKSERLEAEVQEAGYSVLTVWSWRGKFGSALGPSDRLESGHMKASQAHLQLQ